LSFVEAFDRYLESEVNIHYRSPIRAELLADNLTEEELRKRQEGQMKEFYKK